MNQAHFRAWKRALSYFVKDKRQLEKLTATHLQRQQDEKTREEDRAWFVAQLEFLEKERSYALVQMLREPDSTFWPWLLKIRDQDLKKHRSSCEHHDEPYLVQRGTNPAYCTICLEILPQPTESPLASISEIEVGVTARTCALAGSPC